MLQYKFQTPPVEASYASTEIFDSMNGLNAMTAMNAAKAEAVYELTTPSHTENLELIRNLVSRSLRKASFAGANPHTASGGAPESRSLPAGVNFFLVLLISMH